MFDLDDEDLKFGLEKQSKEITELKKRIKAIETTFLVQQSSLPNNSATFQQAKNVTRKMLSTSSIHGVQRMYKAESKLSRIIWIIAILIAVIYSIKFITNGIEEFLRYDVVSFSHLIHEDTMIFPAVVLCVNTTRHEINLKTLIVNCLFDKKPCDIDSDFDTFDQISNGLYNHCMRFNGYVNSTTVLKSVESSGWHTGLMTQLDLPENISIMYSYVTDNYLHSYEQFSPNYHRSGRYYNIRTKKMVYHQLGEPYNKCVSFKDKSYRYDNCMAECKHDSLSVKYNLSLPGYFMSSIMQIFNMTQSKAVRDEFTEKCKEQCPKECNTTHYETKITKELFSAISKSELSRAIQFDVFYEEKYYLGTIQYPKTSVFGLVSSVGGTFGLFIGLKFLTLVEFLEYLIELLILFIKASL